MHALVSGIERALMLSDAFKDVTIFVSIIPDGRSLQVLWNRCLFDKGRAPKVVLCLRCITGNIEYLFLLMSLIKKFIQLLFV